MNANRLRCRDRNSDEECLFSDWDDDKICYVKCADIKDSQCTYIILKEGVVYE